MNDRWTKSTRLLVLAGLLLLFGVASIHEVSAQGTSTGQFPTFRQVLMQVEGDEGGEEVADGIEQVDIDPEVFGALSASILTTAELGFNRPGEIDIRPDRAFKVGDMYVYPLLRQTFLIDDNIFLTDTVNAVRQAGNPNPHRGTRESDFITKTDAGFLSQIAFSDGDHQLEFGGQISHQGFTRRSLKFREEYAGGALRFNFNRFDFEIGDRWEHRFDPIEIEFTSKLERTTNSAYANAGLDVDEFRLEFSFLREDTRFIDFEQGVAGLATSQTVRSLDRAEITFEVRPMVAIHEDYWAFVEYARLDRRMDEQSLPDMKGNRFSAGVRGSPSDRMRLWFRLGWVDEDFETDAFSLIDPSVPAIPGNVAPFVDGNGDSNNGDVVGEIRVEYDLEELTRLDVSYTRFSQFSTTSNFQMIDRGDISLLKQFYPSLLGRIGAFYEYQRPSNFAAASRYGAGIGVQYLLTTWVTLDAQYNYRRRNSSAKGQDYTNNVGGVGATIRF